VFGPLYISLFFGPTSKNLFHVVVGVKINHSSEFLIRKNKPNTEAKKGV
jgi:hypothetical protein